MMNRYSTTISFFFFKFSIPFNNPLFFCFKSFLKVTNVNGTIPVYVDTSGILEQLNSTINSTETKIIVIADNPVRD